MSHEKDSDPGCGFMSLWMKSSGRSIIVVSRAEPLNVPCNQEDVGLDFVLLSGRGESREARCVVGAQESILVPMH